MLDLYAIFYFTQNVGIYNLTSNLASVEAFRVVGGGLSFNGHLEETSIVPSIVLNLTSASIYGLHAQVCNVSQYPYSLYNCRATTILTITRLYYLMQ